MRIVDLSGQRFGRLVAVQRSGSDGSNAWWNCKCDCGNEKEIRLCHLQSGTTKSCGCGPRGRHRFKHGMTDTSEYSIFKAMHQRCENPKANGYENYGGRGIKVSPAWLNFEQFHADMGNRPAGMSLERKNVNGPYSKANCKWATAQEQHRNRRDNHNITAFGKTQCLTAWAEEYSIPASTLKNRLYRANMKPEDALTASLYKQQRGG